MTEYNNNFEIVLYFLRNTVTKPEKPTFQSVQDENPDFGMDDVLDIYSDVMNKYKSDVEKYNNSKHLNKTIESHVFISDDRKFIENVHEFEKNDFFVKWTENSKKTIEETINSIVNVS